MTEAAGQAVFQIDPGDNVATALEDLTAGEAAVHGSPSKKTAVVSQDVPAGHKVALRDIAAGEPVVKYGVVIGQATKDIERGQWVHLHNMKSRYDLRSSSLDAVTGAPTDTCYE
ncbi:MAG TPA: hydrolase [Ruminococcaceae bacterium]|jgi:altronate dehydratase|nr:hydrolase [Oscillospiraceae bacterium]